MIKPEGNICTTSTEVFSNLSKQLNTEVFKYLDECHNLGLKVWCSKINKPIPELVVYSNGFYTLMDLETILDVAKRTLRELVDENKDCLVFRDFFEIIDDPTHLGRTRYKLRVRVASLTPKQVKKYKLKPRLPREFGDDNGFDQTN